MLLPYSIYTPIFLTAYPAYGPGQLELSQLTQGERWGTPWTPISVPASPVRLHNLFLFGCHDFFFLASFFYHCQFVAYLSLSLTHTHTAWLSYPLPSIPLHCVYIYAPTTQGQDLMFPVQALIAYLLTQKHTHTHIPAYMCCSSHAFVSLCGMSTGDKGKGENERKKTARYREKPRQKKMRNELRE